MRPGKATAKAFRAGFQRFESPWIHWRLLHGISVVCWFDNGGVKMRPYQVVATTEVVVEQIWMDSYGPSTPYDLSFVQACECRECRPLLATSTLTPGVRRGEYPAMILSLF